MKILITLTSVLFLLAVSSTALAGMRPSFDPEGCSWRATDIVVVTEGSQIDGNFKVIETWKGDLKPGETISVPELAQFNKKDARLIYSAAWYDKDYDGKPRYVSGERMILFLRDARKPQDDPEVDDRQTVASETSTSRWKPTNPMGTEMKYSTVWIENGKVYCFIQVMNPGDSVLVSLGPETELKTEVDCVVGTQMSLNTALAVTDVAARAESLEPFAKDSISSASDRAFAGLTECGEAALPVLRRMLRDESLGELHESVIEAFAKAGGIAVGPELTAWLQKEVAFWKRIGPTLQMGWWNGDGFDQGVEAAEPLRRRYGLLLHGVYAEERTQYRVETIELQGKTTIPKDQLSRVTSLREGEIFNEKQLDDRIVELNKLGLSLDKDKDVGVTKDHARERVTIKIILDKQGYANESFNRSTMKRSWYP